MDAYLQSARKSVPIQEDFEDVVAAGIAAILTPTTPRRAFGWAR